MTGKDLKNNVRSKLQSLFRKGDQKHNKPSDNDSEITLFPLPEAQSKPSQQTNCVSCSRLEQPYNGDQCFGSCCRGQGYSR
ncbi:hypothetical protein N8T08_008693 [Aspergillus melleus]|uniref:Uncharacterized protein n=1 Tax=Aspergillus melleus TaxID=138277 RepID=A0ACC3BDX0_9EURO|nr:hypothetical protein N8T08_008693 [Aspergillus melleus]